VVPATGHGMHVGRGAVIRHGRRWANAIPCSHGRVRSPEHSRDSNWPHPGSQMERAREGQSPAYVPKTLPSMIQPIGRGEVGSRS